MLFNNAAKIIAHSLNGLRIAIPAQQGKGVITETGNDVIFPGLIVQQVADIDQWFRTIAMSLLIDNNVPVRAEQQQQSGFQTFLMSLLPFLLLIGVWVYFMNRMQGGGKGGAMGFGKSKAKMLTEKHGRVTFDDVAGIDEAKEELEEIVEFLRNPQKFSRLGGKIPKGALLEGPPGTGKTLLASAIAGGAGLAHRLDLGGDHRADAAVAAKAAGLVEDRLALFISKHDRDRFLAHRDTVDLGR